VSSGAPDAGRDAPVDARDAAPATDAAPHASDAADASARATDAADASPTVADAADAASDPVLALGGCVGASLAVTVSDQMPYVDVPVGSESGEFVLDFGSTFSSIDLSAFAPPGPVTTGCDSSELGQLCTVLGFAFFSSPGDVDLTTESFAGVGGSVRQAGILGTDFLSEHVITLDYGHGRVYAAPSATACSASALAAAGYAPLSVAGFYENDLSLLEPLTDVIAAAPAYDAVPNVPTVPVAVAGASAVAQLDTGFDDAVTPFSVNINRAFYAAIVAAEPGALVRDASKDESLTTCVDGVSEPVLAYRLAAGVTFDLEGTSGVAARSYTQAVLFVKDTPAAAASCGGIGTWTAPAAQVGASFYVAMGTLVLDPYGATVWVPR
jgi:hypothetical protein